MLGHVLYHLVNLNQLKNVTSNPSAVAGAPVTRQAPTEQPVFTRLLHRCEYEIYRFCSLWQACNMFTLKGSEHLSESLCFYTPASIQVLPYSASSRAVTALFMHQIRIGPGLQQQGSDIVANRPGVVRVAAGSKVWLDSRQRRCASTPWTLQSALLAVLYNFRTDVGCV